MSGVSTSCCTSTTFTSMETSRHLYAHYLRQHDQTSFHDTRLPTVYPQKLNVQSLTYTCCTLLGVYHFSCVKLPSPHFNFVFFFLNDTAPPEISPLPLHAPFPIWPAHLLHQEAVEPPAVALALAREALLDERGPAPAGGGWPGRRALPRRAFRRRVLVQLIAIGRAHV